MGDVMKEQMSERDERDLAAFHKAMAAQVSTNQPVAIPAMTDERLMDAAEKIADLYEDDDRQDIKTDVMNAFYAGAAFASQPSAQRSAEAMPLGYVSSDQLASWPHTGGSISLWRKPFGNYTVPVFTTQPSSQPIEARETVADAQGDVLSMLRDMIKTEKPLSNFGPTTTLAQSPTMLIKNIERAIAALASAQPIRRDDGVHKATNQLTDEELRDPECMLHYVGELWTMIDEMKSAQPSTTDSDVRDALLRWAADKWHAEVANRPLVNVHRRSLDDTWRQVIRKLGGDDVSLCGLRHDDLLREQSLPPATEAGERE